MEIKKSTLLWGVIAIMFVAVLYLTFEVATTGTVSATAQSATTVAQSASSGMVGGC